MRARGSARRSSAARGGIEPAGGCFGRLAQRDPVARDIGSGGVSTEPPAGNGPYPYPPWDWTNPEGNMK